MDQSLKGFHFQHKVLTYASFAIDTNNRHLRVCL